MKKFRLQFLIFCLLNVIIIIVIQCIVFLQLLYLSNDRVTQCVWMLDM